MSVKDKYSRHLSPLRYPGGKACLAELLEQVIVLNCIEDATYFEPYAGGAGAALHLLVNNVVRNIVINDADRRVYCFWNAVLRNTDQFVDLISSASLDIEEWRKQNYVCGNPQSFSDLEVGFAAFYMNRCNRSGILIGAGPIGGYGQQGKWKLDVRFNKQSLANRISKVASYADQIEVKNMDALTFLKTSVPRGRARSKVFVYLDPPYVVNGKKLYMNSYEPKDHKRVAQYLDEQKVLPWVLSYDDTDLVRSLYSKHFVTDMPINYSLNQKRKANELFIAPNHVRLPFNLQSRTVREQS